MADQVEYLVTGKCFVNGSIYEPSKVARVTVWAAPGLEGPALALLSPAADDKKPAEADKPAADDKKLALKPG